MPYLPPSGTYASPGKALARPLRALVDGDANPGVLVHMGDSTGDDGASLGPNGASLNEHYYLTDQWIASLNPARSVTYRLWSDTYQSYGRYRTIQTGAAGDRYLGMVPGATTYISTPHTADMNVAGDFTLTAKVRLNDWTPATRTALVGVEPQYMLLVNTDGTLVLWVWESAALRALTSTVPTGVADGTDKFIKVDFDFDDGASHSTATFSLSDDGVTWTQLGATASRAKLTVVDTSTNTFRVGARNSGGETIAGRIYAASCQDGIDGKLVVGLDCDRVGAQGSTWTDDTNRTWTITGAGLGVTRAGALGLLCLNASKTGSYLDYHIDAANSNARFNTMVPFNAAGDVLWYEISHSHNGGTDSAATYLGLLDTLVGLFAARVPYAMPIIHAQNPEPSDQANYLYHKARARAALQYAGAKNYVAVNAYQAFLNYGSTWDVDLILSGVHPDQAGHDLWFATTKLALAAMTSSAA